MSDDAATPDPTAPTRPRRVAVTGAAGKTGRVVARWFVEHGYEVRPIDGNGLAGAYGPLAAELGVGLFRADLRDYGQTVDALRDVDAVVHLAAIPAPGLFPASTTFLDNTAMNYNVFAAAQLLGIDRVVWASSETTFGLPFDTPPRYAPIDEDHYPLPDSTYALSKVVGETMAVHFAEWTGGTYIALRLSNVHVGDDYAAVPGYQFDFALRRWNLWGYVDARDVALACERAVLAELTGAHSFVIAAADTLMEAANAELMADQFPGVPMTREVGEHETLLAIDHARELLGYEPRHSWRDQV
ncbi:NAD-dependent epimerase/dehydratase family protein [uncultured Friedmanniella sp.]|uniref:NAD-dependent epimerase/dehydratase family protein n=1 Tax=uncultured Friedmanniella sp. TaxID=335381 RepID=UPI0035CA0C35